MLQGNLGGPSQGAPPPTGTSQVFSNPIGLPPMDPQQFIGPPQAQAQPFLGTPPAPTAQSAVQPQPPALPTAGGSGLLPGLGAMPGPPGQFGPTSAFEDEIARARLGGSGGSGFEAVTRAAGSAASSVLGGGGAPLPTPQPAPLAPVGAGGGFADMLFREDQLLAQQENARRQAVQQMLSSTIPLG